MEIRNLCKTYGEKKVLSSFCADFQPGKRYALMGPSGIGKTTLARLILGLEKPDGGSIRFGDTDIRTAASSPAFRRE